VGIRVPPELERKILALAGESPPAAPDEQADEEAFLQRVIDLARGLGYRHYHPRDSRKSVAGWPDLVLVRPGRGVLFAELKTDTGRLTAAQEEWLECLRDAGQEAHVWRPGDMAEIEHVLREGA
jgi:hypothetical protein